MDPADTGSQGRPRRREPTPAQRALALLVRREHSKQELTRKLLARGISSEDALLAVGKMAGAGWQDDERFACCLARTRALAGYGPLRIRAELASHRLENALVEAALAALADAGEDDWPSQARALVERRFGEASGLTTAAQRKAADFLIRRGFDGDSVRAALRPAPAD